MKMSRQKVSMTLTQIISGSKNQFMSYLGKNICMGLGRVGVLINGNSSVHFRLKKEYIYLGICYSEPCQQLHKSGVLYGVRAGTFGSLSNNGHENVT